MADCLLDGSVLTCSGDLSTGVSNPRDFTVPPVETLIIQDLTADIAPTVDNTTESEGVFFRAEFSAAPLITLDIETGDFAIRTSQKSDVGGALGVGVTAQESDLLVNVDGDIFTDAGDTSMALVAATAVSGDITITSKGVRDTTGNNADGIWAVILDTFVFVEHEGQDIIIIDELEGLGDGNISVAHDGAITTLGENSDGVRAVLGVGELTLDIMGDISTSGPDSAGIVALAEVSIMDIQSSGNITTGGEVSPGIVAQAAFDGDLTVTSTGNIQTKGGESDGINARVGEDGAISLTSTGGIGTSGDGADAIRADLIGEGAISIQSTGNLGTTGADAFGIAGSVGDKGSVWIVSKGDIGTSGSDAGGIAAFVGGDGNVLIKSEGDIKTAGSGIEASSAGMSDVQVFSGGSITTMGQFSHGIDVSTANGDAIAASMGDVTAMGNRAAGIIASADTGTAWIQSTGNVSASDADGLQASVMNGSAFIESFGDVTGGTGLGASALTARVFGDGTAYISSKGAVTGGQGDTDQSAIIARVDGTGAAYAFSDGSITTQNDVAHALTAIARDGNVSISANGTVQANGVDADAIHLEAASGFFGDITVLADTVVVGGSGDGAAIALYGTAIDDASNNFVSIGKDAHVSAASGLAIYAEDGNDAVSNRGTVIGNLYLGNGTNLFENLIDARFEPGDIVGIGLGGVNGTLNNFGEISPFGDGVAGTVLFDGDLVLQQEGTLFVDVAADGTGDFFDIVGSVELGGLLNINALDPAGEFTIGSNIPLLSTTDGFTGLFAGVQDNLADINFIPVSANAGTAIILEIRDKNFATIPDGCTYTSPVIICGGDVSDGAAELGVSPNIVSQDATTIIIDGLSTDIVRNIKGAVAVGLSDYTDAGITIDVTLGEHEIDMPASNGYGIAAFDLRDGDIDITSQGTIRVNGGTAIYAYGEDETNISIDHTGDLFGKNPDATGVWARSYGSGDVMVNMDGDITMTHQFSVGIAAVSTVGDVIVDFDGTLSVQGAASGGIYLAVRDTGNIDLVSAGTLTRGPLGSAEWGIEADHLGNGNISIVNDAVIGPGFSTAIRTGIAGDGDISVTNNGEIVEPFSDGVVATIGGNGNITVNNNGEIVSGLVGALDRTALDNGIEATIEGDGDIEIVNRGDIRAGTPISAVGNGRVVIDSVGDLVGGGHYAIRAVGSSISITNEGDITNGFNDFGPGGISAETTSIGSIDIVNRGDIVIVNEFHDFNSGIAVTSVGPSFNEGPAPDGAPTVNVSNVGDIRLNNTETYAIFESGIWIHQGDLYKKGVSNGTAQVSQTGDIMVTGVGVHGIEVGRSQTNGFLAAPNAPPNFPTYASYMNTTVDMVGSILASGDEAIGIRSAVTDGVTATFNLSGGDITGGSTIGAGIVTLETTAGGLNVFNIGADVTVSAKSGRAFVGGEGIEEINLSGSLVGIVNLDDGDDSLRGAATGTVDGDVDLGDGADRFAFENGFSVTGSISGGMGTDIVEADVAAGQNRMLDLAPLSLDSFEVIEKTGAGTLTVSSTPVDAILLQANGGTSTTSADLGGLNVEVNDGALFQTDFRVGDVTVNAGGTFGGNATTGDLINNGLLSPGNSPGTITVTGDFVQGADGVLMIEFGPTGQTDLLDIAGTASLNGTLDLILYDPDVQGGDIFTFLIADGGINGAFATINTPEGLQVSVNQTGNQLVIEVASLVMGGCVQEGSSVLCEGIDPDGFANTTDSGLDVLVETDAMVLNVAGNGLDLGDGNTVLNQGTINVAGDGIHAGDGNTIVNASSDTIIAGGSGIVTGDDSDVSNPGAIVADGDGIETGTDSIVDNAGTITAGDDGMTVASGTDVINTGTIEAADIGILAGDNHNADLDGDGNTGIVNEGIIDSQVDGIFAGDNNVIVNRGTIFARHTRADSPNDGDFNVLANSALTQQGTGIGVGSDNMVVNEAGATITAYSAGIATALTGGTGNTIINEGTIDAQSLVDPDDIGFGTGISAGEDNVIENRDGAVIHAAASGINAGAGSMVTNQAGATINAVTNGIVIGPSGGTGGTAVNDGEINVSGGPFGGAGILIWDGVTATNNGTINSAASGFYVNSGVGAVLTNNGEINAGTNGFDLFAGSTVTNGTNSVVNATGGAGSDAIAAFGADNVIINQGELLSTGGFGIGIYAVGPTSIDNAGRIEGGLAAIQGGGGAETISNTGVIAGDISLGGGDDVLALGQGSVITGDLDGGGGTDSITSTGASGFEGTITAVEALTVEGGVLSLALTAPSDVTATAVNGGRLDLGGTLTTDAATAGAGVLAGNGVIDGDLVNGGITAPGASIGTLTITGDFTQTADGSLQIEFGPTGQTDLLDVGGAAVLDGTLDYYLVDNGVAVGDVFTFLTAGDGVSGTFSLVNNALGAIGSFDVVYSDFDVSLTILSLEGCIQTGSHVLCIGTDPNGFSNIVDAGLDTLVEADAVVNNPDGHGLTLGDDGTIDNQGTVGAAGDGVQLGAGNVFTNWGTVRGGVAGIRLAGTGNTVDNRAEALIAGPVAIISDMAGQTVINRDGATIDGDVVLSGGDNEVALETGSVLLGGVHLGGGDGDTVRLFGAGEDIVPLDIEGAEVLVKEGDGQWTLNDDLTVGATSVRQGTLIVGGLVPVDDDDNPETPEVLLPASDAILISPLVGVSGGTLGGHGTIVGDIAIGDSGRLAPGASIGALNVVGNLVMQPAGETAGGIFEAELTDGGGHDLLDIQSAEDGTGGAAMLAGTLDVVLDAEFADDDPETADIDESRDASGNRIVQADFSKQAHVSDIIVAEGGVDGMFQQVTFDGGPNDGAVVVRDDDPATSDIDETVRIPVFKGYLEYLSDRVRITSIPEIAAAAETPNQAAVAATLDAAVPYGLSTDPLTGVVSQVGVSGGMPAALDNLHGEWFNAFHETAINVSRGTLRQAALRSLEARSGTRSTSAVTLRMPDAAAGGAGGDDSRARFWISAAYDSLDVDANNGFMGYGIDTLSGYVGIDFQISDSLLLGAMGSFSNADVDKKGGTATGDVDSWQIAGYLTVYRSGWFLDLAGGYGEVDVSSSRDIGFGNVALTALADYDGDAAFFSGRAGYSISLGNDGWQATPEIALTYARSNQDGFIETGAAPVNLAVDPLKAESLRLSGQLRISRTLRTGKGNGLAYHLRAGIAHELKDGLRPITARFGGTTADFTVYGQPGSDTTAVFGAGISGEIGSGVSLFVDYAGEMGGRFSNHAITGGARLRF